MMSKRRTAWTIALQDGAASNWKLALGCAACAVWLVARLIQTRRSSGTDPAEERRLAGERADYFERKGQVAKAARPCRSPARPVKSEDPLSPSRYVPPAEREADKSVSRRDVLHVRDGSYEWQSASALFDTGNESLTVIDAAFARRHALFAKGSSVFAQAERWVTLRGVVPGATVQVPVVTVELRVRGHTFRQQVAVSELDPRTEVLVGIDIIESLWAAGIRIERG